VRQHVRFDSPFAGDASPVGAPVEPMERVRNTLEMLELAFVDLETLNRYTPL